MKTSSTLLVFALVLSSCAPPRPEEREIGVRHQDLAGDVEWRLQVQSSLVTHHVDAPVEQVWAVLPVVFEELEIPSGSTRRMRWLLGTGNSTQRPSAVPACPDIWTAGARTTGRPFADAYQVEMFFMTRVDAVGEEKTRVRTELYADRQGPGHWRKPHPMSDQRDPGKAYQRDDFGQGRGLTLRVEASAWAVSSVSMIQNGSVLPRTQSYSRLCPPFPVSFSAHVRGIPTPS